MMKPRFRKTLFPSLMIWLSLAAAPQNNTLPADSITAAEIRDRVHFFASEDLEGRYPGSKGFQIAAAYAASQFKAAGLLPIAGQEGQQSYLQLVPLAKRTVEESAVLTLQTTAGQKTFPGGGVKLFTSEGLAGDGKPLSAVFAGFGICEPKMGWDDLKDLDITGKVALFMMGAPMENGKPVLPEDVHRIYIPLNSFIRKLISMRKAAAAFVLYDESLKEAFDSVPAVPEGPQFILDDGEPGSFRIPPLGFLSADLSEAIFDGRGAPRPAQVSVGRIPPKELAGVSIGIQVRLKDEKIQTWNVIGLVEGKDAVLKDQVVVVSAHLDHLPPAPDGRFHPGANDNASGAAALLEIAGAVASRPPRRSVLFVLFSAEEGGWMGSRYFLSRGPVPRERIVADINMDMIGRTEEGLQAGRTQYVLDSGRIVPAFTKLIEDVNSRTVGWSLRFEHPLNLGDSDHRSFEALGIPAVNFYTGRIPDTHKPTDTSDKLDYDKAAQIARLVYQIVMELADRNPVWQ